MTRKTCGPHFDIDFDDSDPTQVRINCKRAGLIACVSIDDFFVSTDVYVGDLEEAGDMVGALSCQRRINKKGQRMGGSAGGKYAKGK